VQNDMSTAVMWSKSKPDVEFQYGGRLGEFNDMSFQSHVSLCRVLPLGEFNVTIPEPHAALQGAVIGLQLYKIFNIARVSFLAHIVIYVIFGHVRYLYSELHVL